MDAKALVNHEPANSFVEGENDMDAKALVNHEPIDLTMETLGFQNKNKNQVLACVLTWKLEEEES